MVSRGSRQQFEAVFENGVLRPLTHTALAEHQRVRVTVEVVSAESDARRSQALEEFIARAERMQFRSTGPYPTRDELHDRS
jgi:predicted DNA-binding antitoxin AbrB/MazE fold protein